MTVVDHNWHKAGATKLYRLKVDPLIDPLRDDERFKEMLKRLKMPE